MGIRTRKLVGGIAIAVVLFVYIFVVAAIAETLLPGHWAIQIGFFAVAGVAWAFPLRGLVRWMNQPDPNQGPDLG